MTAPFHSATHAIRAGLSVLCRAGERVAMVLLISLAGLIIAQVLVRNLMDDGFAAAEELARFAGVGMIFLAAPLLLARGAHIRVDLIDSKLPRSVARVNRIVCELLCALFCAAFLYAAWMFMQRASQFSTPVLAIPNLIYYAPALVGMFLLLLVALQRALNAFIENAEAAGAAGALRESAP